MRLNLQSIITNVQLTGFDIKNSEMCTFCLQHPETISHSFLNWKNVKKVLERYRRLDLVKITRH